MKSRHERNWELWRLAARPVFLLADLVGFFSLVGSQFLPDPWKAALATVGSACLAIGFSLPVALFYQLRAEAETMNIIDVCHHAGIKAIFENRQSNRLRTAVDLAAGRSNEIRLSGVALCFVFDPTDQYSEEFQERLDDPEIRLRVLLLDPNSPAATLRNEIEKGNTTIRDIHSTITHGIPATIQERLNRASSQNPDIQQAVEPNRDGGDPPSDVLLKIAQVTNCEVHIYEQDPMVLLMGFRDSLFAEQYHVGRPTELRAASCIGKHLPVTEFSNTAPAATFLSQHFESLWDRSKDITQEVVKTALKDMHAQRALHRRVRRLIA